MNQAPRLPLRIGSWCVDPLTGQITQGQESVRLEARTLRLLLLLAERPGDVFSIDEMLDRVWAGVIVTPDSVYQAIASLRRELGDDPRRPTYIATVPRLGYRLVAEVSPWAEENRPAPALPAAATDAGADTLAVARSRWKPRLVVAAAAVGLAAAFVCIVVGRAGTPAPLAAAVAKAGPRSVAILPFLDLTEGMHEETFADGMTEELIDKISKLPGFKVPAPTAVFFFKDKQLAVAEIARSLGVVYLVDGSVRQSGERVRVAARLERAEDGFVLWSESYDRPFDDLLSVQDDLAIEVRGALLASIDRAAAAPAH
ncbi:MAG: winged helix-turn-helix domain-containing protein [Rudaea sp.]